MDNEKTPIEIKLDQLQNEQGNIQEIIDVFNDYFGEDLVDSYRGSNATLREHIMTFDDIGRFLGRCCSIVRHGDMVRIALGNMVCQIATSILEPLLTKSMLHFPEELLPLIEEYWYGHTRDVTYQIIVRFPEVTVTNENNKSVKIQELYARIFVKTSGNLSGKFELIRSYYPLDQWNSDYCHSHISHISTDWLEPCTGSGPINRTMARLHQDNDLNIWGLFCYELDKFVRVESIAGVPYRRLESIGLIDTSPVTNPCFTGSVSLKQSIISNELLKDFIETLIKNMPIKVAYMNGSYTLGESFEKFWIKASRVFAKWYNEKYKEKKVKANLKTLITKEVLGKYLIKEGKVYTARVHNRRSVAASQGEYLFDFKGEAVRMVIEETLRNTTDNQTYLLSLKFISKLIQRILVIINYNYGRQKEATTEEETAAKGRTVYF